MADACETLYAGLRAELLVRHFAVGRFWRVNQYDSEALLGEYRWPDGARRLPCGPLWEVPRRNGEPLYRSAEDLRHQEAERFRIAKHDRTNSLLVTGYRAIGHAMEHRLGHLDAPRLMRDMLATFAALLKFDDGSASPFSGYMLRWDAVASDRWLMAREPAKPPQPIACCEFPLNPDAKAFGDSPYLYCVPFDDPRYRDAVANGNKDLYRRWEPSIDEYVGVVSAYVAMFDALKDTDTEEARDLIEEIRRQTRLVGRYLQHSGYLLLRPCGGFTGRGFAEMNPVLHYPFSRAFELICGERFAIPKSLRFRKVMQMAGYDYHGRPWLHPPSRSQVKAVIDEKLGPYFDSNDVLGALGASFGLAASTIESIVDDITGTWFGLDEVDVVHDGDRKSLVAGAVLMRLSALRPFDTFQLWMSRRGDGPSESFKPFIGLIGAAAGDLPIVGEYLHQCRDGYYPHHANGEWRPPPSDLGKNEIGGRDRRGNVFNYAVAMQLSASPLLTSHPAITNDPEFASYRADRPFLEDYVQSQLEGMQATMANEFQSRPPLLFLDRHDSLHEEPPGAPANIATELLDCAQHYAGYLCALAVTWRHVQGGAATGLDRIALPTVDSCNAWARPAVEPALAAQLRLREIEFPLVALDTRFRTMPTVTEPLDALRHAPPRARDTEIGNPPPPQQGPEHTVDFSYAFLRPRDQRTLIPAPPLQLLPGETPDDYMLVKATEDELVREHVDSVESSRSNPDGLVVAVRFGAPELVVTLWPPGVHLVWRGRYLANYSVSWVRRV